MRFPSESHIHFIECTANGGMEWKGAQMESVQFTHGIVSCCEWTGVKVSTLLDEVGVDPKVLGCLQRVLMVEQWIVPFRWKK